jgi:hypothetical protein
MYYILRRVFVSKFRFVIQFLWLLVNVTWINSDVEGQRTMCDVYSIVPFLFSVMRKQICIGILLTGSLRNTRARPIS